MAQVASRGDVRTGQRETGAVVIERSPEPGRGRMAGIARRRVRQGYVVWHGAVRLRELHRAVVIRHVAARAQCRHVRAVAAVRGGVAGRARHTGVESRQREGRGVVIERRARPIRRGMADRAIGWEGGGNVVRHRAADGLRAVPVRQMAGVADRRRQRVVVADVAEGASRGGVRAGQRETRRAMIPGRRCERCHRGGVTVGAIAGRKCRECRSHRLVRGRIGRLPGRQVATRAIARRRQSAGVIAVYVTKRASHRDVQPGQRERRAVVIERRRRPIRGRVAKRAVLREIRGHVVRNRATQVRRAVVIGLVAAPAGGRQRAVVIVIHVAEDAGRGHVRARQGEGGSHIVVIERGARPAGRGVAVRANVRGERRAGTGVRRVIGVRPVRQMALGIPAIRRCDLQRVVAVDVALRALQVGMAQRQRESEARMIEGAGRPRRNRVAAGASRGCDREICRDVVGHVAADGRRALVHGRVAAVAVGRVQRVVVTEVAGSAGRRIGRHVRSHQREAGDAVIERGRGPTGRRVAVRAVRRGKCGAGSRVDGLVRLLPGRQMALRIAALRRRDRQRVVAIDVALRALQIGVALR